MDLEVTSRHEGRHTVVAAQGEIDLTSCVRLRDSLDTAEIEDTDAIVVDLTRVGFIDSTGLSVLVNGARHARAHDRTFGVVADGHLRELLRITGLDTVMSVHPNLADAIPEIDGDASTHEEAPHT